MKRISFGLLSLILGLAAAAAALAIVHAANVSASPGTSKAPAATIAKRQAALDRHALALKKARARRPPRLPKVPKFAHVHIPVASSAPSTTVSSVPAPAGTSAQPKVVYERPPAVVRYTKRPPATTSPSASHEDEHEDDDEHEGEGGYGGDDGSSD